MVEKHEDLRIGAYYLYTGSSSYPLFYVLRDTPRKLLHVGSNCGDRCPLLGFEDVTPDRLYVHLDNLTMVASPEDNSPSLPVSSRAARRIDLLKNTP